MKTTDNTTMHEQPAPDQIPPTSKHSHRTVAIVSAIVAGAIICIALGVGGVRLYDYLTRSSSNPSAITDRPTVKNDGNQNVTQQERDIASVVEKVSPSVVSIVTSSQSQSFYGSVEQQGAGTGIIISKDGYVLTNKHVVASADTYGIVLSDGTSYENVKLVGTDPLNDVAFLKIPDVNNLKPAPLGDSTTIRVGQSVIAIGNSLGQYQNTVTMGIVSGLGRPISAKAGNSVETLTDLIQTDAAINPGNSGGPLLNLAGQVIGINTAIVEGAQGVGFSIPIGATKGLIKGVLAGDGVHRAYLGVNYIPITADVAKHYKLPVKDGAYIYNGNNSAIAADSPAAKAGLRDKDIITKVNDLEVGERGGVSTLLGEYAPGDTVDLTVLRGNRTTTIKVTLAAYRS